MYLKIQYGHWPISGNGWVTCHREPRNRTIGHPRFTGRWCPNLNLVKISLSLSRALRIHEGGRDDGSQVPSGVGMYAWSQGPSRGYTREWVYKGVDKPWVEGILQGCWVDQGGRGLAYQGVGILGVGIMGIPTPCIPPRWYWSSNGHRSGRYVSYRNAFLY